MFKKKKMKSAYIKSLIISITIGALFTITLNVLTTTYFVQEGLTGTKMVLTGIEAIQATINDFGVFSYIRTLVSYFLIFSLAVFLGCIWINKWNNGNE